MLLQLVTLQALWDKARLVDPLGLMVIPGLVVAALDTLVVMLHLV